MAAQDEPALEAQEEVLADGLDAEEPPPVEALRDAGHPRARMRRLDLEPLADERSGGCGPRGEARRLRACCKRMHLRWKRAGAGAVAAIVWGALEPIDQRLFR